MNKQIWQLNPNPLAASNHHNGKSKPKGGSKFENWKKACPTSSGNGRPIICFGCNKLGHKKSECPEKKDGNMANAGAARGRPVAMATQETHYASMAQVAKPSLTDSMIKQEPKKLLEHVGISSAPHPSGLDDRIPSSTALRSTDVAERPQLLAMIPRSIKTTT